MTLSLRIGIYACKDMVSVVSAIAGAALIKSVALTMVIVGDACAFTLASALVHKSNAAAAWEG